MVAKWKLNEIWIVVENLSCGQMLGSLHEPFSYKQLESPSYNLSSVIMTSGQHLAPDSKVHGTNMGPIWGQQDPGGPHVGPMNFVIWGMLRYIVIYQRGILAVIHLNVLEPIMTVQQIHI